MEDWAEIRRLHRAEAMPIKAIARRLGVSRNAVQRALARDDPPRYQRPVKGSCVDGFEPAIRELPRVARSDLAPARRRRQYPSMLATVIAERVGWLPLGHGFEGPGA